MASSALIRGSTRGLGGRSRGLPAVLQNEQLPAKRAAAREEAAAFTAFVGLVNTEILTNLEAQACERQGPMMDARAKSIVDSYAGLCATELARLALRQE